LIGATRNKILPEATKLIELTGLPYFVTTMGKGSVSEHLNSYGGVYCGVASNPEVKKAVESSDCILWLGNYPVSSHNYKTKGNLADDASRSTRAT
jgi:pyruvate decarboxylase